MDITILALLFNGMSGDNISIFQRTEAEERKNGFLELSCDVGVVVVCT